MYRILQSLATHGLGEIEYPLSKDKLQTGLVIKTDDERWIVVDCRDLLDDQRNKNEEYLEKIRQVQEFRIDDHRVLICCGAGQSRSNAIALGYLVSGGWDYYRALEKIKDKVPICFIGQCHLDAIKEIYGVTLP